jgi:hypothetical protein
MSDESDQKAGDTKARVETSAPAKSSWPWAAAWIATVAMVVGGGVFVFKSCRDLPLETMEKGSKLAKEVSAGLAKVASAFRQGTINTTFTSYATEMSGHQFLQVATLTQHERFTRTDEATTAFGYIPLPEVIVEADAPITYTYYVDFNEAWNFTLQDGQIIVTAPDLKFNKPAVDVSRMTYEVRKNSVIRDTRGAMEALKNSITWMAHEKARTNVNLVRETSRMQTQKFVQNWLAKAFSDGKNYPVAVRFRSEVSTNAPALPLDKKQD